MEKGLKTYMFCNAHLDPVWLWQCESDLSEGISTFRAASEFVDEYPDYEHPSEDFIRRGYDGESELLVHRSDKGYNSVFGKVHEELPHWMEEHKDEKSGLDFWGVGNHGGGSSRKDLDDIAEMKKNGANIVHVTPDEYFATVDTEKIPVEDDTIRILDHGLEITNQLKAKYFLALCSGQEKIKDGKLSVETVRGREVIYCRTGYVDSYVVDGKEYLKPVRL